MRILITGSNGMLGTELCEVLAKDHEVVGIDISKHYALNAMRYAFYEADITDSARIEEVFRLARPELVIHTAAWTDVDGCEKNPAKAYAVNAEGTKNIMFAMRHACLPARQAPCALLYISTDFVFDGNKTNAYVETDSVGPLSIYGKSKLEGEKAIVGARLIAPLRYAIVRTSWLFGTHGKNFVDTIIGKVGARLIAPLQVVNDQVGSPTYAKDLAEALSKLIAAPGALDGETYHLSNSGFCSWYDFAGKIFLEIGVSDTVTVKPIKSSELARPAARPKFSVLDNGKFVRATGHKMRPWQDALKAYLSESRS